MGSDDLKIKKISKLIKIPKHLEIDPKYLNLAVEMAVHSGIDEDDVSLPDVNSRIANYAIFISNIYKTAKDIKIKKDYIEEQIDPITISYDNHLDNYTGKGECYSIIKKNLGKLRENDAVRILRNASKQQKKDLASKLKNFVIVIGIAGSLCGLSIVSLNLVGNVISNSVNSVGNNIIGASLFICGLFAILISSKKLKFFK